MRSLARVAALAGLAGTILPPTLFLMGRLELPPAQWVMLLATLLWFAGAPFWLEGKQ